MNDEEKKAVGCLAAIPLGMVVLPVCTAMYGGTLSVLWRWFAVPIFGLPALGVLQAIGIMLVVHMFTTTGKASTDKDDTPVKVVVNALVFTALLCGLSLLEGWVVLKLMGH